MKKVAYLAVAGLLSTSLLSGCSINRFSHKRLDTQIFDAANITSIDVSTFNGSVEVIPHDLDEVNMQVTFRAYGPNEEQARLNCDALDCEVTAEDGIMSFRALKPSGQWSSSVNFQIYAPRSCSLVLNTSNGGISAEEFPAGVKAKTSNGTISLKKIGTKIDASTSNGTIVVKQSNAKAELQTSNGRITYVGKLIGRDNSFTTSNGRIEVQLPPEQAAEIEARTSNGSVSCDLPVAKTMEQKKTRMHVIVGKDDGQEPRKVKLRTSNGSIRISALMPETLEEVDEPREPKPAQAAPKKPASAAKPKQDSALELDPPLSDEPVFQQ